MEEGWDKGIGVEANKRGVRKAASVDKRVERVSGGDITLAVL